MRVTNPIPLPRRIATARKLGTEAGMRCLDKAAANDPEFKTRALDFIVAHVREKGRVAGEDVTLAAVNAGIKPHDLRAFGSIYATALRRKLIRVVAYVPRVRGHGSAGGKVYMLGEAA